MSILGPDGKPRAVDPSEARCVLCEIDFHIFDPILNADQVSDECVAQGLECGVAFGYFVGLNLMASVLIGSGLEPEKAVRVQDAASSLCDEHTRLVAATGDAFRVPVEQAIRNLQAKGTFIVGRSAGGKVRVTP